MAWWGTLDILERNIEAKRAENEARQREELEAWHKKSLAREAEQEVLERAGLGDLPFDGPHISQALQAHKQALIWLIERELAREGK